MILKSSIKYNLLSFDELVINLDRLSRFKLPEDSFQRVFSSILLKHLIEPKYSKKDIENEDAKIISKMVRQIWNASTEAVFYEKNIDKTSNSVLKTVIKNTFKNIDEKTEEYLNTDLNIASIIVLLTSNIDIQTAFYPFESLFGCKGQLVE